MARIQGLTFSKLKGKKFVKEFAGHSEETIKSTYGFSTVDEVLNSSTLQSYLNLGTNYRINAAITIGALLHRKPQEFTENQLIKSINILSTIIEKSHGLTLQTSFPFLVTLLGSLMYKLLNELNKSTKEVLPKLTLGRKTMNFLKEHQISYA